MIYARISAAIAGHEGEFIESYALPDAMRRKVPKNMIGRVLSQKEANALLARLG